MYVLKKKVLSEPYWFIFCLYVNRIKLFNIIYFPEEPLAPSV